MEQLTKNDIVLSMKLRLADLEAVACDYQQSARKRRQAVNEAEAFRVALKIDEMVGMAENFPRLGRLLRTSR